MEEAIYRHVPGRLVIAGREPDGDSIRFVADDPGAWRGLRNAELARFSPEDGAVQVRLEGIDAPELHYAGLRQPMAEEAREALLAGCRFERWRFGVEGMRVVAARPARGVRAVVMTKAFEGHGRPVAYVVVGGRGRAVWEGPVGAAELEKSLNFGLLARGSVYPLFYSSMPVAHRDVFQVAAAASRRARRGVWARDRTQRFRLAELRDVAGPDAALVMPKLFRRVVAWLRGGAGRRTTQTLPEWMVGHSAEDDHVLIDGQERRFSQLVHQRGAVVRFDAGPGPVVWLER